MKSKLNNKKIIITLSINLFLLIAFITTITTLTNEKGLFRFNFTGFTFAEFIDTEIMYTLNAYSNEETTFVIPIKNNKESLLKDIHATIEIYDLDNNLLKELETEKINLEKKSEGELRIKWQNNLYPGSYKTRIYVNSEETNAVFTKTFKIEARTISIESILINNFELGKEINIEILIQNHLDKEIKGVKSNILIYDELDRTIANLKSETKLIEGKSLSKLENLWNTEELTPGIYNAKLRVEAQDYLIERDLVFSIDKETMSVTGVGFAINYKEKNRIDTMWIIIIFVILILFINIVIWRIFLKKHKIKKS
jgi:hypothetical protein